ncbi:hypothetical protein D9758_001005 [Tetrapyrgos nigripes]|uniref:GST N-terminal domain-containing protein n=1 Tax=Tetrapyrgos nigripes TaxID=182062 RepID=A0A8H5GZ27_9AGAR|nr:hypothetical protein D9758_017368 [Tetrapyrgos nigripes]KAF5373921.1 hypothetical protein D9758_001005 [Tetrapyrgos nigripes]
MITLYDIRSTRSPTDPRSGYSPFSWRVRFTLRIKGLPYKHHWIEYPDIEGVAKSVGADPTAENPDGSSRYTVPFIHDSTTNKVVSNSFDIVDYLDSTYPDTIKMIPEETRLLQSVFADSVVTLQRYIFPVVANTMVNRTPSLLTPRSLEAMRSRGSVLELTDEQKKEAWAKLKDGMGDFAKLMNNEGPFVMGKKVCMADAALFGTFAALRWLWDETTNEWKDMMSWHGGRWSRLMEAFEGLPEVEKYSEAEGNLKIYGVAMV